MQRLLVILFLALAGCGQAHRKIATQVITVGENKCSVQWMPESFHEGKDGGHFDYFRIMIDSRAVINDSNDLSDINFGMDRVVKKIVLGDTLMPAFVQRIANGRKNNYEYVVSFEKDNDSQPFSILINDETFKMGELRFQF